MGLSNSVCNAADVDHVDAETFPLKILLNEAAKEQGTGWQWSFFVEQMGKS